MSHEEGLLLIDAIFFVVVVEMLGLLPTSVDHEDEA